MRICLSALSIFLILSIFPMEKLKRALRLSVLICMMVLASIGMSITGAAPVLPKHKEAVMEDESKSKKNNDEEQSKEDHSSKEERN
jgi:hypothetical protein